MKRRLDLRVTRRPPERPRSDAVRVFTAVPISTRMRPWRRTRSARFVTGAVVSAHIPIVPPSPVGSDQQELPRAATSRSP